MCGALVNSLRSQLPPDCDSGACGVVVIVNAFDVDQAFPVAHCKKSAAYVGDIQTELLVKCCSYGKVRSVFTPAPDDSGYSSPLIGCVLVSFVDSSAAIVCGEALHRRLFDDRLVCTCVFLPGPPPPSPSDQRVVSGPESTAVATDQPVSSGGTSAAAAEASTLNVIEEDVDDFLNSLL